MLLEDVGHEVETAPEGEAGLEVTRAFRPDLIITDLSMPGMGGLEFLVRLRSDIAPPIPPVIVCSGFDATAAEALRLGAACFVTKPIDAEKFLSIVAQVLEGRGPDPSILAQEQELAHKAGERAAETAARMMKTLALTTPDLEGVLKRFVQRTADYFEIAPACIAVLDNDDLKVLAASRGCPVPAGARFRGGGRFSTSILAARSCLVLPDARPYGAAAIDGRPGGVGLGFVVAVPLVLEDVPIGALVLLASEPHRFSSEDLSIFESVGRVASQKLGDGGPIGSRIELWPPSLADVVLTAELSSLRRERGGFDLVLVDVDPQALTLDAVLALVARGGQRFSMFQRQPGTLALFKRDSNAVSATTVLSDVLSTLSTAGALGAAGWISLIGDGMPLIPADLVLQLGVRALEQARANPGRRLERIEVRVTPSPGLAKS